MKEIKNENWITVYFERPVLCKDAKKVFKGNPKTVHYMYYRGKEIFSELSINDEKRYDFLVCTEIHYNKAENKAVFCYDRKSLRDYKYR